MAVYMGCTAKMSAGKVSAGEELRDLFAFEVFTQMSKKAKNRAE